MKFQSNFGTTHSFVPLCTNRPTVSHIFQKLVTLKGQSTPKIKITYCCSYRGAIYPSTLFGCEWYSWNDAQQQCLSRNHDPVTQDKPQTLWWACRNYCLSTKLHHADGSLHLLMVERLALVTPQGGDINSVLLGWRKQLLHEAAHNRVCGLS